MNALSWLLNPIHATDLFWYQEVFWCFQEVSKVNSGMKWVEGVIRKVRDAKITIFTNLTLIVTLELPK